MRTPASSRFSASVIWPSFACSRSCKPAVRPCVCSRRPRHPRHRQLRRLARALLRRGNDRGRDRIGGGRPVLRLLPGVEGFASGPDRRAAARVAARHRPARPRQHRRSAGGLSDHRQPSALPVARRGPASSGLRAGRFSSGPARTADRRQGSSCRGRASVVRHAAADLRSSGCWERAGTRSQPRQRAICRRGRRPGRGRRQP
jgi:hypothetical protein